MNLNRVKKTQSIIEMTLLSDKYNIHKQNSLNYKLNDEWSAIYLKFKKKDIKN